MNDWNMTKLNELERKVGQQSSRLSPREANQLKDEILSTRAAANFFGAPDDMVRAKLMSISNRLEEPDYYSSDTGYYEFDPEAHQVVGFIVFILGIGLSLLGLVSAGYLCLTPGFVLLIFGLAIMNHRALRTETSNLTEQIRSSTQVETLRNKLSRMSKRQKILIGILIVMDVILFSVIARILLG